MPAGYEALIGKLHAAYPRVTGRERPGGNNRDFNGEVNIVTVRVWEVTGGLGGGKKVGK